MKHTEKQKQQSREYYRKHRKEELIKRKERYRKHRKEILQYGKEYYIKNRLVILQCRKEYSLKTNCNSLYYHNHKDYCKKKYKEWVLKNPQRRKETSDKYLHSPKATQKRKEYCLKNKELLKVRHQNWRRNNPEKSNLRIDRRRARKYELGGSHTAVKWIELKKRLNFTCQTCGEKEPIIRLTKDHIIPLTKWNEWIKQHSEIRYQWNDIENIQPLCQSCNSSKKDKIMSPKRFCQKCNRKMKITDGDICIACKKKILAEGKENKVEKK